MTRLPSDRNVADLFETLRKYATIRTAPKGPTQLDVVQRRLVAALARARTPAPERDGYPTATGGSGARGQRTITVPDESGQPDAVPVTGVEATAIANVEHTRMDRDVVLDSAMEAFVHLLEAVNHLGAVTARLDALDRVSTPKGRSETGGAGTCAACSRWVAGSASDRIRSGYCDACRKAWERDGRPERASFERARRKGEDEPAAAAS